MLLLAYGVATLVVGNTVVARLANRRTISTLLVGTTLNALFLTGFAAFTDVAPLALAFMLGIVMAVLAVLVILPALGSPYLRNGRREDTEKLEPVDA